MSKKDRPLVKVPKGKMVSTLEYDYNGKISWKVG